jgi:methionyl-tRNA synthetase
VISEDRERAATVVNVGIGLVRFATLIAAPFTPFATKQVLECLGEPIVWPAAADVVASGRRFRVPPVLFPRISAACRLPA